MKFNKYSKLILCKVKAFTKRMLPLLYLVDFL